MKDCEIESKMVSIYVIYLVSYQIILLRSKWLRKSDLFITNIYYLFLNLQANRPIHLMRNSFFQSNF